ncbi:MAG: DinB family protein [Vicinamibacterales bacterium]
MTIPQPHDNEYPEFYAGYVGKVPPSGPVALLEAQKPALGALGALSDERADHRYADGKWSVKEVLGHMADAERVFAYRLLRIARGDQMPLAGFDENAWAVTAPHGQRRIKEIADEMSTVRAASLTLYQALDATSIARQGTANNASVTARALAWILAGHAQHHLDILRERYGVTI